VEALVALYKAGGWWSEEPDARQRIPALITGSFCFMVARLQDGRIAGMARLLSDGVSDAYIQDVVVLPEWRGRGIGRELVRRLVEHCRSNGIGWIGLIAEPGTRHFYEDLGFKALLDYIPMRHGTTA
jgi:aralkylamine N-acetyltransferase